MKFPKLKLIVSGLVLSLGSYQANAETNTDTTTDNIKPNIVLIISDDMGRQDLASYGSDFHESPNLTQLASEGMQFNNTMYLIPVVYLLVLVL